MPDSRSSLVLRTALSSLCLNLVMALVKWITGILGHSFALIADAIESTGDVFSSFFMLLGLKISHKPPDEEHPYGHGKAEVLVTFFIICFLLVSATLIAYHSIYNIRHPHPSPKPFTLIVLGAIILFKEISFQLMMRRSTLTGSTALKAEAWHHRSDALTSIAAFMGISISIFLGEGYAAADDWAALLASGFIFYNSFRIFKLALSEIMDEQTHGELIASIRLLAQDVEGVISTEKCYVRKSGIFYFVDLHMVVDPQLSVLEGHALAHRLKDYIVSKRPEIHDVLIHVEPYET